MLKVNFHTFIRTGTGWFCPNFTVQEINFLPCEYGQPNIAIGKRAVLFSRTVSPSINGIDVTKLAWKSHPLHSSYRYIPPPQFNDIIV